MELVIFFWSYRLSSMTSYNNYNNFINQKIYI